MRRADRNIVNYQEMMTILKKCDCCRLGFQDENSVYIVPLNFGYAENHGELTLYFHGADQGKKLRLLKEQTRIGFEMDTGHKLVESETACGYSYLYESIMGEGDAALVEDVREKLSALKCIMSHYSGRTDWAFREEMLKSVSVIRLKVATWSCKAHSPQCSHS